MASLGALRLRSFLARAVLLGAIACLAACDEPDPDVVQGYVEGEYVYVSSPIAGTLETLGVERGQHVDTDHPLFTLDATSQKAAVEQVQHQIDESRAQLADLEKGQRPPEIAGIEAQLAQARAALEFSERELQRQLDAQQKNAASEQAVDAARTQRDEDRQRVAQLEASLETAKLAAREDRIAAAKAAIEVQQAALAQAQWNLDQMSQAAPQAALVFDTLFRPGEWVGAGKPIVALLPPENIKVRAFVSESRVGSLHLGDRVSVYLDGPDDSLIGPTTGSITYISPRAEYTPPVIYSRESRGKLVFMIEIHFAPDDARTLHPGQPVDVRLPTTPAAPANAG